MHYSRRQRHLHTEFTTTFTDAQVAQWTNMMNEWKVDYDKPDPFQEAESSE